jgi:hypothetical protein
MTKGKLVGLGIAAVTWLGAAPAWAQAVDEATLHLRLFNPDPERGYAVRVAGDFHGMRSPQDGLRVEVKQGGRTLASRECAIDERVGTRARFDCATDDAGLLTATGPVVVELHFRDDQAETTSLVRSLAVEVRGYPYWVRDEGARHVMGTSYQIDAGSLVGTAFVRMDHAELQQTSPEESQLLFFYTAFGGRYEGFDSVLRCRVGEERLPDFSVSTLAFAEVEVDERLGPDAEIRHVSWYRARLDVQNLWWGQRLASDGNGYALGDVVFLGEHPGLWSCDMRSEGAVLRTFRFVVDASGRVAPHALETSPGAPPMTSGLHVVDVRFPSPGTRDAFFEPGAIRAGYQYGTPWPSAAVAEMLAALPPAAGSSAPTARGASGRSGRGGRR